MLIDYFFTLLQWYIISFFLGNNSYKTGSIRLKFLLNIVTNGVERHKIFKKIWQLSCSQAQNIKILKSVWNLSRTEFAQNRNFRERWFITDYKFNTKRLATDVKPSKAVTPTNKLCDLLDQKDNLTFFFNKSQYY